MNIQIKKKILLNRLYKIIRAIIIIIPIAILAFLLYIDMVPQLKFKYNFTKENKYISKIDSLNEEVKKNGKKKTSLENGINFFTVDLVDIFTSVKVKIKFKGDLQAPFGLVLDEPSDTIQYFDGPAAPFTDSTIIKYEGTLYVVENGLKRPFDSLEVFRNKGYNIDNVIEVSKKEANAMPDGKPIFNEDKYTDGTLLSPINNSIVYLIEKGQKRPFFSDNALDYKYNKKNIIRVNEDILREYPTGTPEGILLDGTVVKEKGDNAIYVISDDKKLFIDSPETFDKLGYRWDDIKEISSFDASLYNIGDALTPSSFLPDGTILESEFTGQKYLVENGIKKPFISEKIYNSGYRDVIPVRIPAPEFYSRKEYYLNYPVLNNLEEPEWKIIRKDDLVLFQRVRDDNKIYKNIEEFLEDIPDSKKIAILPNYKVIEDPIRYPLLSHHLDLLRNINNEDLKKMLYKFEIFNQYTEVDNIDYILGYYRKPSIEGESFVNEYDIGLESVLRNKEIKFFLTDFGSENTSVDNVELTFFREPVSFGSILKFIRGENR